MIYVAAQFVLLIIILWPLTTLTFSIAGLILIIISIVIALSALLTNRLGNFNIRPQPKKTGVLIVNGPYQFIRHPMYTALWFAGAGILFCQFSFYKLIAWVLLIIVLAFKARYEEKALCLHYSEYQEYQKSNRAFIPWLW